eukprot:3934263-Rhodomonas_salina.1
MDEAGLSASEAQLEEPAAEDEHRKPPGENLAMLYGNCSARAALPSLIVTDVSFAAVLRDEGAEKESGGTVCGAGRRCSPAQPQAGAQGHQEAEQDDGEAEGFEVGVEGTGRASVLRLRCHELRLRCY